MNKIVIYLWCRLIKTNIAFDEWSAYLYEDYVRLIEDKYTDNLRIPF